MSRLLVVPDSDRVEQWLLEETRHTDFVDLSAICTLSQLVSLCDPAGMARRAPADPLLVRMALGRLAPVYAVSAFGAVAHTAEFSAQAQRLLGELRAQAVSPQQLEDAGAKTGSDSLKRRTRALATLWRELDVFLAERQAFELGDWWRLATARLERDGLPAALRRWGTVEVRWVHDVPLAKLRFLEALARACLQENVGFVWRWPSTGVVADDALLADALREIEARWPQTGAEVVPDVFELPQVAPTAFSVPTPRAEVREIARRVREMMKAGVPPEAMAVAFREPQGELQAMVEALQEVGVPARAQVHTPLMETPAARLATSVLKLLEADFPADDFAALLESRYVKVLPAGAAEPGRAFREAGVRDEVLGASGGKGAYETRLRRAPQGDGGLLEAVTQVLTWCRTIPPQATALELLESWWDVVTRLGLLEPARALTPAPLPGSMAAQLDLALARDQQASEALAALLTRLKEALNHSGLHRQFMTRREFLRWVEVAMAEVELPIRTPRAGAVSVLDLRELVGRRFAQLFLGGFVDGRLPGRPAPLALLGDEERVLLNRAAKQPLFRSFTGEGETRVPTRLAEDRFLFHVALASAGSTTLSRARLDDAGREVLASPFREALLRSFPDFVEVPLQRATTPAFDEAQTEAELRLRVALEACSPRVTRQTVPDARAAVMAERFSAEDWFELARSRGAIETERLRFFSDPSLSPGPYSGRVEGPVGDALRARLTYDADHPVAAHELSEWGTCAFRGLSTMVLGLEARERATEELDSRTRGTFWHEALGRVVPALEAAKLLGRDEASIRPHVQAAVESAAKKVAHRSQTGHPALWTLAQEWAVTVITRVLASPNGAPFGQARPTYVELSFGAKDSMAALRHVVLPAVKDSEVDVHLTGRMDRVDLGQGVVAVLDYKTSLKRTLADEFLRSEFQMAFYVFAARALMPDVTPAGGWLGLSRNEQRTLLSVARHPVEDVLAVDQLSRARLEKAGKPNLANAVFSLLGRLREGDFGARPLDCGACKLKAVCRISQRQLVEDW